MNKKIKQLTKIIKAPASIVEILFFKTIYAQQDDVWIFGERSNQAKNNGLAFFEYISKRQKDINSYYVIDKNRATKKELNELESIGRVVHLGSYEHKKIFCKSSTIMCTHSRGNIEPWNFKIMDKFFNRFYFAKKFVFLGHGITKDDVSDRLGRATPKGNFDLFACSVDRERDYIAKNFGYKANQVKNYGNLRKNRIDEILKRRKPEHEFILLMPTWRSWLKSVSENEFIESDFYKSYQGLINDKVLIKKIEDNSVHIKFFMHNELNEYKSLLNPGSKNIEIIDTSNDVQTLFAQCSMLITDYSSIAFDVAALKKPLLYFQFDKKEFFEEHYKKGYFSYEDDGFGSVVENIPEVTKSISASIDGGFNMTKTYKARTTKFFVEDKPRPDLLFEDIKELL